MFNKLDILACWFTLAPDGHYWTTLRCLASYEDFPRWRTPCRRPRSSSCLAPCLWSTPSTTGKLLCWQNVSDLLLLVVRTRPQRLMPKTGLAMIVRYYVLSGLSGLTKTYSAGIQKYVSTSQINRNRRLNATECRADTDCPGSMICLVDRSVRGQNVGW